MWLQWFFNTGSKGQRLVSILFLLKLNRCILESPACCVIEQLSSREGIEKWVTEWEEQSETKTGMIMSPVIWGSLPHIWTDKLLTETDSTSCQTLDAAVPEGESATKCVHFSCLDSYENNVTALFFLRYKVELKCNKSVSGAPLWKTNLVCELIHCWWAVKVLLHHPC